MIVEVELNAQQIDVLRRNAGTESGQGSLGRIVSEAFRAYAVRLVNEGIENILSSHNHLLERKSSLQKDDYAKTRLKKIIKPVSGLALPMNAGEVMRITQIEDGGQCVDFNAFNIRDHKERLDVGRTRAWSSIFPKEGSWLYSNSPRDRAMFEIVSMPPNCKCETLGARCNAALFERGLGFEWHTNCQDTFAETIGAYDLTPDDVHDSFNMWMFTEIDAPGITRVESNRAQVGEYIDLLAVFDVLAVPIVCGSGDVMFTSNFKLKPIQVEIFEATDATAGRARDIQAEFDDLRNSRDVDDFRVQQINPNRELRLNPDYEPEFFLTGESSEIVDVYLEDEDRVLLEQVAREGSTPGQTDDEIIRACAMLSVLRGERSGLRR